MTKRIKNKWSIFTLLLAVVLVGGNFICSNYQLKKEEDRYYKYANRMAGFDLRAINKVEEEYKQQPTPNTCFKLMNAFFYYEPIKNYQKAYYYGMKCVDPITYKDCYGIDPYLVMASVCEKLGKHQEACSYLNTAISYDTFSEIDKFELFKKVGIQKDLIEKCKENWSENGGLKN